MKKNFKEENVEESLSTADQELKLIEEKKKQAEIKDKAKKKTKLLERKTKVKKEHAEKKPVKISHHSKKYREILQKYEKNNKYPIDQAIEMLSHYKTNYDESLDVVLVNHKKSKANFGEITIHFPHKFKEIKIKANKNNSFQFKFASQKMKNDEKADNFRAAIEAISKLQIKNKGFKRVLISLTHSPSFNIDLTDKAETNDKT